MGKRKLSYFFKLIFFPGLHRSETSHIITIQLTNIVIKYLLIYINAMFSNDHSNFLASSYYLSETSLHARVCVCVCVTESEREIQEKERRGRRLESGGH